LAPAARVRRLNWSIGVDVGVALRWPYLVLDVDVKDRRRGDQRARIVGLYREGKPDWDGVKQPVQRHIRPRPRSTWVEPRDAVKPYGLEDQGGLTGLDDPNRFIVLKSRQY
jgi:hypothetical protein